jgi:hypothetical protein
MRQSKKILLTTCTLLLAYTSFAQINVDSLLQNQPLSKTEVVVRTRATLIDAFAANDRQKVKELHSYIFEKFEDDDYVALFPEEQILLFAWCGDFENLLAYRQKIDSAYLAQLRNKIMPPYTNNFYQSLEGRVQQEAKFILNSLQASSLQQEGKDFLVLLLRYYLLTDEDLYYFNRQPYPYSYSKLSFGAEYERADIAIGQINVDTRKFIAAYPNSEHIKLLSTYELKPANWGFEMSVNFGYTAKTGDYSKSFKNGGNIDMNVGVAYQKYVATIGLAGTFGSLRKDIVKSNGMVLPKDTSASLTNFYLSFGQRFFENKRIIVTPSVGVGTAWIKPGTTAGRKHDSVLEHFDYSYGLTTHIGVTADIRLGKMKKIVGQDFASPSFFAVRLNYKFSFNDISKQAPTFYNGNLHTLTVGFYMFGRSIKTVAYK